MFRCYCFDVIDFWLDSATAKDFVFALNHMHKNVSGHKLGKAGKKNHRTILVRPLHTQFTQAGLENPVLHWRHFFPAAVRFKLLRLKWSGFHAKTSADPAEAVPDGLTQVLLQCCYSAVTVLLLCCNSVVTMLLRCCDSADPSEPLLDGLTQVLYSFPFTSPSPPIPPPSPPPSLPASIPSL
jgi:hypothetical protein